MPEDYLLIDFYSRLKTCKTVQQAWDLFVSLTAEFGLLQGMFILSFDDHASDSVSYVEVNNYRTDFIKNFNRMNGFSHELTTTCTVGSGFSSEGNCRAT